MNKKPGTPSAGWKEAFGKDADEYFHAWAVATYVGQVAAAGKAEYPLPLYANAALRIRSPGPAGSYESGGPTDNVIPIWKVAAPALDLLAPDIYMDDYAKVERVLELYQRADNPLLVPEISNAPEYARFFFLALGHRTIGFAPFGIDYTGFVNFPLGAKRLNEEALAPFAMNYRLVGPMMRELAQLSFDGKIQGRRREEGAAGRATRARCLEGRRPLRPAAVRLRRQAAREPRPIGRALVAQLGDNQFLVAGFHCRVDFQTTGPAASKQRAYLKVEEGVYDKGKFKPLRLWNGDQTDWGLNFTSAPQVLRVTVGRY